MPAAVGLFLGPENGGESLERRRLEQEPGFEHSAPSFGGMAGDLDSITECKPLTLYPNDGDEDALPMRVPSNLRPLIRSQTRVHGRRNGTDIGGREAGSKLGRCCVLG